MLELEGDFELVALGEDVSLTVADAELVALGETDGDAEMELVELGTAGRPQGTLIPT